MVKSRLGASVLFDCLWRYRGKTGLHANGKVIALTGVAADDPGSRVSQDNPAESQPFSTKGVIRNEPGFQPIYDASDPVLTSFQGDWTSFPDVDWLWDFDLPYDPMTAAA